MRHNPGQSFRQRLATGDILPLVGIHDVFSAKLAGKEFDGVFCSGFSYTASTFGLPDVGYITWRDISDFALRVRHVLPKHHLLVDVDDGFGDSTIAAHVVRSLESNGVSAVMLEDQKRPRRCGHFEGKEILPVEEYLNKLKQVLEARQDLFVIARTDATYVGDGVERAVAYAQAGADGVMVEAVRELEVVRELRKRVTVPIMLNQLHGGKSPNWSLEELAEAGVSIVIYSTPTLFSAQYAMQDYLYRLKREQRLPETGTVGMGDCSEVLFSRFSHE